ncbi:MAG: type III pantothenate kinase [Candidatus Cloacimonetes bacterium]|nr:type III pantothenate kinase [Candidatus Cloacimonadota bacterium]
MYNIVFDVGNSHIVIGIYRKDHLEHSWRLETVHTKTEDEYYVILRSLLDIVPVEVSQFDKAALSSVVPVLTRVIDHMVEKYLPCPLHIVDACSDLGLRFPMPDPGFIGSDLVVNAFAAREKYKTSCIIVDFGTATTLQLVGRDGFFYGTIIAPGIQTSAASLFAKAAQLAPIKLESPRCLLGTTTRDALLSGIINGNKLMMEGLITRIRKECSDLGEIRTIATGGISHLVCQDSSLIDIIDKTLTLDGLNLILERI